jgi:hypothetical protein
LGRRGAGPRTAEPGGVTEAATSSSLGSGHPWWTNERGANSKSLNENGRRTALKPSSFWRRTTCGDEARGRT